MKTLHVKTLFVGILLSATFAHADVSLTVGTVSTVGTGGPCWDDILLMPPPQSVTGDFTLSGLTGTGVVSSAVSTIVNNVTPPTGDHEKYSYSVDMTGLGAGNHCVKLIIHFGTPLTCAYDVSMYSGSSGVPITSATKAPLGDITFVFNSGCLTPGQQTMGFFLIANSQPKNGSVTIIDDYVDPASGHTNESRIQVAAIVPDIPPNWAYVPPSFPFPFLQGHVDVTTNQVSMLTNTGPFDFTYQLFDAPSNGLPVGPISTQTVQLVNGLFNLPLPGDPSSLNGAGRWLNLAIRPSGLPAVQFQPLTPRQQISPAPLALYAFSAGVVADITPDQAVLNLNGFTGGVTLQAGNGISINGNLVPGGAGGIITISGNGQVPSDRNLKTDFVPVSPGDILEKLVAMPIESWRFTNELAGTRHLGPTAQDFRSSFGLGAGNTTIGLSDEGGVAFTAIKALNQKIDAQERQIQSRDAEIKDLKDELENLREMIQSQQNTDTYNAK